MNMGKFAINNHVVATNFQVPLILVELNKLYANYLITSSPLQ